MSLPTQEPNATYLADITAALDLLRRDDTKTAALLRERLESAEVEIVSGQMTTQTDVALDIAHDINRGWRVA
jgi:hypothetical protein